MNQPGLTPRHRLVLYVIFGLGQFLAQSSALLKGTEYIVSALTFDDAYYYFQTAWNLKNVGIATFDGLNPTNGVQLLWFGLVYLLGLSAATKIELLWFALITCFFCNAAGHLVIWKLSEILNRPVLGFYLSSFWFFLTFGSEFYSTGMENSLHAFIFWLVIWQMVAFLVEKDDRQKKWAWLGLTLTLILNVWARLDAAIFSLIIYGYCLLAFARRKDRLPVVILSIGLALAGLALQLAAFYRLGGTWLPISALVKHHGSDWSNFFALTAPRLLLVLLLLPGLEIICQRYARQKTPLREVWYCLLLGVILHVIATGGLNAYDKFLWYLSPSFVFLTLTLAYLGDGLARIISRFIPLADKGAAVVFALACLTLAIFLFSVRLNLTIPAYKLGYRSALWISENLPPEVRLASWNAGILGYFSGRTVINLDGLINGREYYEVVITGPTSWPDYVKEQGVNFVIDYHRDYVTVPDFPLAQRFSLAGQENEVLMWAVTPPAQGSYRHLEFAAE
jgi:hypothetical protein